LLDLNGNYLSHDWHGRRPPGWTNQDQAFHVKLRGHGQDFHVELQPNHRLLAPGFAIHRRWHKATKVEKYDQSRHCHFHGKLLSHGNSSAAISTCGGLVSTSTIPFSLCNGYRTCICAFTPHNWSTLPQGGVHSLEQMALRGPGPFHSGGRCLLPR